MKLRFHLFLGYIVVFACILTVTIITLLSIRMLRSANEYYDRASSVMRSVEQLGGIISELEFQETFYFLTGDNQILELFKQNEERILPLIGQMKPLLMDTGQIRRLDRIEQEISHFLTDKQQLMEAYHNHPWPENPSIELEHIRQAALTTSGHYETIQEMIKEFESFGNSILQQRSNREERSVNLFIWFILLGNGLAVVLGIVIVIVTTRAILRQVGGEPRDIGRMASEIAQGRFIQTNAEEIEESTGIKAATLRMSESLRDNQEQIERQNKALQEETDRKTYQARISDLLRGDQTQTTLSRNVITSLCKHLEASTGLFYLIDETGTFRLNGSYAHRRRKNLPAEYRSGEGLVGQVVLEKEEIILTKVPKDYITIESGLGETVPKSILLKPILYEGEVIAVIDMGTLGEFTGEHTLLLDSVSESIAMAIIRTDNRMKLTSSLEEAQALTEELQSQQEELRTTNEELEEQTKLLKESEEKLRSQQEELQVSNEELEEKNEMLRRQKDEVDKARGIISEKAEELSLANKYKSEFLANMSHELRTPLNSLLLLAQSLRNNKEGNLTRDQVESASIIYKSGNDLLNLINEILDLSKIEAGRLEIHSDKIHIKDQLASLKASFRHLADEKGLKLSFTIAKGSPDVIHSDSTRMEQVLRNLISNAIKFTEHGSVAVTFKPEKEIQGLAGDSFLAVEVKDTGIGIPKDQQLRIFEAFQQGDGSTARNYGGTGLGLSISRQLARLLGGEIRLESIVGTGSTFTLLLPTKLHQDQPDTADNGGNERKETVFRVPLKEVYSAPAEDDRDQLTRGDKAILVVEDDPNFARILYQTCHEKEFKCILAQTGEEGLKLAEQYLPQAVILDIRLPGMNGWDVLSALKEHVTTRHIPVHIVSVEEDPEKALNQGAVGHATKPLNQEEMNNLFNKLDNLSTRKEKRVLVVEDNEQVRKQTKDLLADKQVMVDEATNGKEALEALENNTYDCLVLDLGLPDMKGERLLDEIKKVKGGIPPIVIYTARELKRSEEILLREYTESIIIKDVRSQERLLDEVSLFLHSIVKQMPERKRQIIQNLYDTDLLFRDKKVLIVDDDMRTVFALSKLFSDKGMQTFKAENGEKALKILNENPEIDIVLLDIMMPVMDGFSTLEHLRKDKRFSKLPVISLTAKAMKQDRERCLAAGASDYITKPIEQDRLISLMRVWLYR